MERKPDITLNAVDILQDYATAAISREASLVGRREVLSGKAKFGIFGDGKEVAQVALARAFQPGDWRSGYYRDQTLMLALELTTVQQLFAQLYAHADIMADPASSGRQMNAHFATHTLDENGNWLDLTGQVNVSADVSPTGSQMPRLVGLGYASRLYRELEDLQGLTQFSRNGNEVAFGTIGNASCAEGMFWEAVNAIGVLQAPVVIVIWDDSYGISVSNEYQVTKQDLSALLSGFQREPGGKSGFDVYMVQGWDYAALVDVFAYASDQTRREHVPAIVHVTELTQPQGHSTSGSHERYKSAERLAWEAEYDCVPQMRAWILAQGIADEAQLDAIEAEAKQLVEKERASAWDAVNADYEAERDTVSGLLAALADESGQGETVAGINTALKMTRQPIRKDMMAASRQALFATRGENSPARQSLAAWRAQYAHENELRYGANLYSHSEQSVFNVPEVSPAYAPDAPEIPGFQVLNANFDAILASNPLVVAFGEDVGHLGGVNQTFMGLQEKYGKLRVSDTGIRETTIIGQAIGLAMRGLRPIAEIQYLDYLHYALQIISDDLATVQWRTNGRQKAPVIVSTRGHRLEGVWHSGSPLGGIINLVRGIHVLVPRNMTQAAGFYNTMLRSDEPALIIEVLNAYRLREKLPRNVGEFTIPVGVPEIVQEGDDITVVTYGACVPIALQAAERLAEAGISLEVIDVRSLVPFDRVGMIGRSLEKTNRVIFLDEDVPGGSSAYMMQQVIETQGGFWHLDAEPRTLPAKAHRPAYGSDGGYFSKPGVEDVVEAAYDLMNEFNPRQFPAI